jgi:hypothetical protein
MIPHCSVLMHVIATRPIDIVVKSQQAKKVDVLLRHGALLTPADSIVELLSRATDCVTNDERPATRRRSPLSKSVPSASRTLPAADQFVSD